MTCSNVVYSLTCTFGEIRVVCSVVFTLLFYFFTFTFHSLWNRLEHSAIRAAALTWSLYSNVFLCQHFSFVVFYNQSISKCSCTSQLGVPLHCFSEFDFFIYLGMESPVSQLSFADQGNAICIIKGNWLEDLYSVHSIYILHSMSCEWGWLLCLAAYPSRNKTNQNV